MCITTLYIALQLLTILRGIVLGSNDSEGTTEVKEKEV